LALGGGCGGQKGQGRTWDQMQKLSAGCGSKHGNCHGGQEVRVQIATAVSS
jgi:hypothetical protein